MRALRSGLMAAMSISIFIMVFPNHTLSQTTQPNLRFRAQSVILMDAISGQILYEQTPQLKIAPASLVKILTLYMAFDAIRAGDLKMGDVLTVSAKAWKTGGSKMFLKAGERVRVEDLIKGVAIVSGNDAMSLWQKIFQELKRSSSRK